MATKKELEARIAALEAEVSILKAQKPVQPGVAYPYTYPYWPYQKWPYSPITHISGPFNGTQSGPGQISINAVN